MERTRISQKELNTAHVKALDALRAWRSPRMVPSAGEDVYLCSEGRIHRAFAIANRQPVEKHDQYRKAIDALCDDATRRRKVYQAAIRAYEDLCAAAGVKPDAVDVPQCTCEGCQLLIESL